MLACVARSADNGCDSLWRLFGSAPKLSCLLPVATAMAGAGHDEARVFTVNMAVTTLVPDTVVFGSVKQPFVRAGLKDTVHAIMPL